MPREIRHFCPHSLVEVTQVTFQNRPLLRPSQRFNELFLGVLGRAQARFTMPLCGVVVLSTHYHLLAVPRNPEHLARFMHFLATNLSKEIGRLRDWQGQLWQKRYNLVPVSNEEKAQVKRLRYLLAAGVKEGLVDQVAHWPGIHSARHLIEDRPLVGHWFDRTAEYIARQRKRPTKAKDFVHEERVFLSPLPCWRHLASNIWRRHISDLVQNIEAEATEERQISGRKSLGAQRILTADPIRRPTEVKKSPKPRYHAVSREAHRQWFEAFAEVLRAYRQASAALRAGDRWVSFPEGTFPPALPFVPFSPSPLARDHPA